MSMPGRSTAWMTPTVNWKVFLMVKVVLMGDVEEVEEVVVIK